MIVHTGSEVGIDVIKASAPALNLQSQSFFAATSSILMSTPSNIESIHAHTDTTLRGRR